MKNSLPLLFFVPALPVLAQEGFTAGSSDLAGSVGQMLFGLAGVVIVMLACLWVLKKITAPRGSARGLKVLGAAPVGPRERVVLVEIADKILVLGVASGQVSKLHTLEISDLPREHAAKASATNSATSTGTSTGTGSAPDFAGRLRQLLDRRAS